MFCIVTVVHVHVLYCDSGTCTCFVLWQWYVYMFCIVTALGERKVWKAGGRARGLKRSKKCSNIVFPSRDTAIMCLLYHHSVHSTGRTYLPNYVASQMTVVMLRSLTLESPPASKPPVNKLQAQHVDTIIILIQVHFKDKKMSSVFQATTEPQIVRKTSRRQVECWRSFFAGVKMF
jgi:hypothetical protein